MRLAPLFYAKRPAIRQAAAMRDARARTVLSHFSSSERSIIDSPIKVDVDLFGDLVGGVHDLMKPVLNRGLTLWSKKHSLIVVILRLLFPNLPRLIEIDWAEEREVILSRCLEATGIVDDGHLASENVFVPPRI